MEWKRTFYEHYGVIKEIPLDEFPKYHNYHFQLFLYDKSGNLLKTHYSDDLKEARNWLRAMAGKTGKWKGKVGKWKRIDTPI